MRQRSNRISLIAAMSALAAVLASPSRANILDPTAFTSLGTLTESTGTFTFDTSAANANPTLKDSTNTTLFTGVYSGGVAVFDFTNIAITGGTFNVTGTGTTDPLVLLSQGALTMNGTINLAGGNASGSARGLGVAGGGAGGNKSAAPTNGSGPGAGLGSGSQGGGGGGFGGAGGNAVSGGGTGGSTYGTSLGFTLQGGSGGGGGGGANGNHGGGGAGGGAIELGAVSTVSIGGTLSAGGGIGDENAGNGASGGGGSGGGIFIHSGTVNTLTNSVSGGTVTLSGAALLDVHGGFNGTTPNANNSGVSGGGGGAGRILVLASSFTQTSSNFNLSGGGGNLNGQGGVLATDIPEPSSLVLAGLIAGGFFVARRWRKVPVPA